MSRTTSQSGCLAGYPWAVRGNSLFVARLIAQVRAFGAPGVPLAFCRIDKVVAGVFRAVEADIVKHEKFCFWTKVRHVGNATGLQKASALAMLQGRE